MCKKLIALLSRFRREASKYGKANWKSKMKKVVTIIISFLFLKTSGQTDCKLDTFDLTLAYEVGGQFSLDDQIIKSPGLVKFDGKVTIQNYKAGYFEFPYLETGSLYRLTGLCKLSFNSDSLFKNVNPFDSLLTKTWKTVNKTYEGKGETMLGVKTEMPPLEFNYKILQLRFIAVYVGTKTMTLINIDRKNKKQEQLLDVNCPQYVITKILNIRAFKEN